MYPAEHHQVLFVIILPDVILKGPYFLLNFAAFYIFPSLFQGAVVGVICGYAANIWLFTGAWFYPAEPQFKRVLPVTIDNCTAEVLANMPPPSPPSNVTYEERYVYWV